MYSSEQMKATHISTAAVRSVTSGGQQNPLLGIRGKRMIPRGDLFMLNTTILIPHRHVTWKEADNLSRFRSSAESEVMHPVNELKTILHTE